MAFALNQLGQVALPVTDVDRAEAFYERTLGLRLLRENRPMSKARAI